MNLQEFISESLVQIVEGINDANQKLSDIDASIPNELPRLSNASKYTTVFKPTNIGLIADVEFDVKIEIVESKNTEGAGGVNLHVLSIGAGHEIKDVSTCSQNLRFTIPLSLPGKINK